jgi:hypothetical protein
MVLGVDDFKAKLRGGGARPNLFKCTLNFPAYANANVELASFMCKSAALPAGIIEPIAVPFRGRQLHIGGDRTFEPWTVSIINDTDFGVRDPLERWMNGINGHKSNTGLPNPSDYQVDLIVEQLDRDESVLKKYNFRGCFPTNIGAIELSYDTTGTIEEFVTEFQVQYWESNTTG